MEKYIEKFFLGANSAQGFVSEFPSCYDPADGWKAYIIKGGPGTGKSSFMKYIAQKAEDNGIKYILFPCGSDPQSLDCVILPQKKIAVLDGTAPHIVEPRYPGVCEQLLNFGQFWDCGKLSENRSEILKTTEKNKALHRIASRYLAAAGQMLSDSRLLATGCTDKEKTARFALSLCRSKLPDTGKQGSEKTAFLSCVTPLGIVTYDRSVTGFYPDITVISDRYGGASGIITEIIRRYAIDAGYNIITLRSPLTPQDKTDHILIPELHAAFVTEDDYIHFDTGVRRIHARRFTDMQALHLSRHRLAFNRKTARQLLLSAISALEEAKSVHDEIEAYYIKAMDFTALTSFVQEITGEILG